MVAIKADSALDLRNGAALESFFAIFDNATISNTTSSSFTVTSTGTPVLEAVISGEGFVYFDDLPISGTIRSASVDQLVQLQPAPQPPVRVFQYSIDGLSLTPAQAQDLASQPPAVIAATILVGNDSITGSDTADKIDGFTGADRMRGNDGNDVFYVDNVGDRAIETRDNGIDTVISSVDHRLSNNLEVLKLTGTADSNATGNQLDNTINGNRGDNLLLGGGGNDILRGYGGADGFVFNTRPNAATLDHIRDFSAVSDTLRLDNAVFRGLAAGQLDADAFKDIGKPGASVDANDRVIYNSDTGALHYDANGSGAGGRSLVVILDNRAAIDQGDILVV